MITLNYDNSDIDPSRVVAPYVAVDDIYQLKASHEVALDILNKIADMPRKTREQRLAYSCVKFLDSLDKK